MRLSGKTALVTGAGSGIGEATAVLFGQEKANVVISDIQEKEGESTSDLIISNGGTAKFVSGDVSVPKDAKNIVEKAIETYGSVDVVVNSAGIISGPGYGYPKDKKYSDPYEQANENFNRVIEVNLKGSYLICWQAIQWMKDQGGGSIVNISSINGVVGAPIGYGSGFDPYPASKGGVIQMTKNLAIQYGSSKIRVNCICPGHVNTPLTKSISEDQVVKQKMVERYPLGRFAEPMEIAHAALFLASEESSFITGTPLLVDGGYTAM